MRRAAEGLRRRVGHRGATLLFLALVDFVYCYRLLYPSDSNGQWIQFLARILPLWVWAVLWGGVGLLCLLRSWRRRDSAAFAFAIGIKVLWALLSLTSGLTGAVDQWYVNAVIFAGFAAFAGNTATWPEPPRGWKERAWTPPSS
ncbi:hypothetical protein ACGFIP_32310 [Micromonospora zamorensis]|uniref:hypothetical protein n=1 Tax=Micromonospora zamorensis TaxID=709883 RepID=UPI003715A771